MRRLVLIGAAIVSMGTPDGCPLFKAAIHVSCNDIVAVTPPGSCYELPLNPCTDEPWGLFETFDLLNPPPGITESISIAGVPSICAATSLANPVRFEYQASVIDSITNGTEDGRGFVTMSTTAALQLSASPMIVSAGDRVDLTAVYIGALQPPQLAWSLGVFLDDPADPLHAFAFPSTTATFSVSSNEPNGTVLSSSVTVTVRLQASPTATPPSIASGQSVQLDAGPSGGDGRYSYQWSPASGLSDASARNPTATPGASTTYAVTVTDGQGQMVTAQVPVTVSAPALVASFVYRQPSTRVPFDVTLDASASTGNIVSYEWDLSWIPGAPDFVTTGPIAIFTRTLESLRGTITLTVRDANGESQTTSKPYP